MPDGDTPRVWFPEMLDELKEQWNAFLSWEEHSTLCERMTERREELRQERGLEGPSIRIAQLNHRYRPSLGVNWNPLERCFQERHAPLP